MHPTLVVSRFYTLILIFFPPEKLENYTKLNCTLKRSQKIDLYSVKKIYNLQKNHTAFSQRVLKKERKSPSSTPSCNVYKSTYMIASLSIYTPIQIIFQCFFIYANINVNIGFYTGHFITRLTQKVFQTNNCFFLSHLYEKTIFLFTPIRTSS